MKLSLFSISVFLIFIPGFAYGQSENSKSHFPPLVSALSMGNDSVVMWGVKTTASVSKVDVTPEVVEAFKGYLKDHNEEFAWADVKDEIETEKSVYKYTYRIENIGQSRLKINFSNSEFVSSPFTQVVQDFSLVLEPREVMTVEFVANGEPKETLSPMNIGEWDENHKRWNFGSGGSASLYATRWNALHIQDSVAVKGSVP